MANNNNLIYNAARNAFLASSQTGGFPVGITAGQLGPLESAAGAYATEVDAAIPFDAAISGAGGVTLPPTTAAITVNQNVKTQLIANLTQAFFSGRTGVDAVVGDYAGIATTVAVAYGVGVTGSTLA
jgi:hypothetical protein